MLEALLHGGPSGAALVGFAVLLVLMQYWQARRGLLAQTGVQGHPAADPMALLGQSARALLGDRRLPAVLVLVWLVNAGFGWNLRWRAREEFGLEAPQVWAAPDPSKAQEVVQGAAPSLTALKSGLPGAFTLPSSGPGGLLLGLVFAALMRQYRREHADGLSDALWARSRWVVLLSLVSFGVAWAMYCYQFAHLGLDLNPRGVGALLGSLFWLGPAPIAALSGLYIMAVMLELALHGRWDLAGVTRRVLGAYVPWVWWVIIAVAGPQLAFLYAVAWSHGVFQYLAGDIIVTVLSWAPIVLFPLPWLLLSRESGLVDGLQDSLSLIRRNARLVLLFAVRLAAVLAPAFFLLALGRAVFAEAFAPRALLDILEWAIEIVAVMAVCRAVAAIREGQKPALAAMDGLEAQ